MADIIGRDSSVAPPDAGVVKTVSDLHPVDLSSCGNGSCEDCAPTLPAMCDDCPNYVFNGFVSYDSFKGVADGGWQNNGVVAGFNLGTRLGVLSDMTGIGFQIGISVGVFDWSGTDYRPVHAGFGAGRKASSRSGCSVMRSKARAGPAPSCRTRCTTTTSASSARTRC